ncbi:MAG: hypothetical protein H7Y20_01815 [Bryobacteraceae bacterium]|nr:hypothetical protein [Bryobacteraceae bacterium]
MTRYSIQPIDAAGLKTISIHDRGGKVRSEHLARPWQPGEGMLGLLDSMPRLLAADSLRSVIGAMIDARAKKKQIIWGLGGHVVKCGLAPILIHLMKRGWATAFSMNGSAAIHDFEIAIAGQTSEDVEAVLPDGRFGTASETATEMNQAIVEAQADGIGMGEAYGKRLDGMSGLLNGGQSLVLEAYRASVPLTVHVAVGTDTPHSHPSASGAGIGAATHRDFLLFGSLVAGLNDGGVYLNVGSAVIMPEVFLKAVSLVRNLGNPLAGFTTVNFDFLQHYRPRVNVVERPHASAGGKGYAITGHHEIMIPLLAACLAECEIDR